MDDVEQTVSDLGELRLLREIFLPDVEADDDAVKNDDCAHVKIGSNDMLWSIDPCPTPVANWFGKASPEVWGCYTATINLSDIAASGGQPIGMLISLEMPNDTPLSFVRGFQRGLMSSLTAANARLLGGNIKSAKTFSATGTIVGRTGSRTVSRKIEESECTVYLIGPCCNFWASVIGNYGGWKNLSSEVQQELDRALCFPTAQVYAGAIIGSLSFPAACMDCSDGAANAIFQLANLNQLDVTLLETPTWATSEAAIHLLNSHSISVENAGYGFGDWQLACIIPTLMCTDFEKVLSDFSVTKMGTTFPGVGLVRTENGRVLRASSLNQNFSGGYNSVHDVESLIEKFLRTPVFE